jgi:hypothetical protein
VIALYKNPIEFSKRFWKPCVGQVITLVLFGCSVITPQPSPSATSALGPIQTPTRVSVTIPAPRTITPILPPATRLPNQAEITLRWDEGTVITDVDDVTELGVRLQSHPGIKGAYGDEFQITVVYDRQQTAPEQIRDILAEMGFPTRAP